MAQNGKGHAPFAYDRCALPQLKVGIGPARFATLGKEIFGYLAKGRDAKFLENHLCISYSTAKSHIYSIYIKLDIHSRQEIIDLIESIEIPEE